MSTSWLTAAENGDWEPYDELVLKAIRNSDSNNELTELVRLANQVHGEWFGAVKRGDLKAILMQLQNGVDVDATNRFCHTALTEAVRNGQLELIRLLLEHEADPSGWNTMTAAAEQTRSWPGHEPDRRPWEMLLSAGGRPELLHAILLEDVELARQICDADSTLDVSGTPHYNYCDTYLMEAIRTGCLKMVRFLLDRGANIEGRDDFGNTALFTAVEVDDYEVVKLLLDCGANLKNSEWQNPTPLSIAAEKGLERITTLLLSRGAQPNLRYAVAVDDVDLFERLLRDCSDSSIADAWYGNPLFIFAVVKGNTKIVRLLLERGVPHHDPEFDESPALVEAAKHGHSEIVKLLIQHGADANGADREGLTPTAWAMRKGHHPIADLLCSVESDWCI